VSSALVYVHGVVGSPGRGHHADYLAFHRGVESQGVQLPDFASAARVELWDRPAELTGNLAAAQEALAEAAPQQGTAADLLTGWLTRPLRELIFAGWSDVFYYLSPEGEERTRLDTWNQLLGVIPPDRPTDLILVCHSGGTLVVHDFLFYLYGGRRRARRAAYADQGLWDGAEKNWRIRALITLGSPLVPLMVRSADLVDRLARDPSFRLDPGAIGLRRPTHSGDPPRWLNVWDPHDVLSHPVAGLYHPNDRVVDLAPDVGDLPHTAHAAYWRHPRVHRAVARLLGG
jgi:hypothetical protein